MYDVRFAVGTLPSGTSSGMKRGAIQLNKGRHASKHAVSVRSNKVIVGKSHIHVTYVETDSLG